MPDLVLLPGSTIGNKTLSNERRYVTTILIAWDSAPTTNEANYDREFLQNSINRSTAITVYTFDDPRAPPSDFLDVFASTNTTFMKQVVHGNNCLGKSLPRAAP